VTAQVLHPDVRIVHQYRLDLASQGQVVQDRLRVGRGLEFRARCQGLFDLALEPVGDGAHLAPLGGEPPSAPGLSIQVVLDIATSLSSFGNIRKHLARGEPLEIGFNAEFLREGIESVSGDELRLRLISSLRPGLIRDAGDDSTARREWQLGLPIEHSDHRHSGCRDSGRSHFAEHQRLRCGRLSRLVEFREVGLAQALHFRVVSLVERPERGLERASRFLDPRHLRRRDLPGCEYHAAQYGAQV